MATCRECFTSCFHAFYPSALLKWFSLCSLLQQIDPVSTVCMDVREKERERDKGRGKGEVREIE